MNDLNGFIEIEPDVQKFLAQHPSYNGFAGDSVVEILRNPFNDKTASLKFIIEEAKADDFPIDEEAVSLLSPYKAKLAGMGRETKYRIGIIQQFHDVNPLLRIVFAPTTYEESTGFHKALLDTAHENDPGISKLKQRLAGKLITPGKYSVPGIAVVHVIVITGDNKLILSKRSPHAGYHPSRWSISFEEQINQHDFVYGNEAISRAVLRGFREEFVPDHRASPDNITILSVFLEYNILNTGFCALLQTPLSFEEIKSSWNTRARDKWEAVLVEAESFSLDNITNLLRSNHYGKNPGETERFHPTARYRLLMAAVYKFGLKIK